MEYYQVEKILMKCFLDEHFFESLFKLDHFDQTKFGLDEVESSIMNTMLDNEGALLKAIGNVMKAVSDYSYSRALSLSRVQEINQSTDKGDFQRII